ncbi:MAG: F0F1 ATP synthase subunit B, partial [Paraburkholderia sp.]
AQADADRLRAAATAEAETARVEQDKLVAVRATQLAVDIAAKLLAKLPENVRVSGFIDGLADAIAHLSEPVRAQLGADGVAFTLAAPLALSPQELEQCRTVISGCLNRAVSLAVEVDPQLIAGLELRTAHAVVRNNFGADLAQIRAALLGSEHVPS